MMLYNAAGQSSSLDKAASGHCGVTNMEFEGVVGVVDPLSQEVRA